MKYQGVSIERAQRIIASNNELELMQFSGELKRIYDKHIKNNNKEQNIEELEERYGVNMNKMIKLTDLDNKPIYLRKDMITAVFESKEYNTNDLRRINDEADSYETYEKKFEMLPFKLYRIVKVGIDGYKVKESIQDILDAIESN